MSLNQAERVAGNVAIIVSRVELGHVVGLEHDAAGAKIGDLGRDVVHLEPDLRVASRRSSRAREDEKAGALGRFVADAPWLHVDRHEAERLLVEAAGTLEIGRGQGRVGPGGREHGDASDHAAARLTPEASRTGSRYRASR